MAVLVAIFAAGFVYYVVPRLAGIGPTLRRLRTADVWWLVAGVVLEALSMSGDIAMFGGVFASRGNPIGLRRAADIRFAGAAATKLFAAAGAGGIALSVWTLRAWGLSAADIAGGMACYMILTYAVYLIALAVAGFGLWLGVFSGPAPLGLTLVPASIAAAVLFVVLSMLYVDVPVQRFLERHAQRSKGRAAGAWRRAGALPQTLHDGMRAALAIVRRRDPSLLGAVAYWGFDIGALWASFHAFGHSPSGAVLVAGYFIGTLGSTLPLPAGIGGVEGGMIGAFLGFGVSAPVATLAVLGYRTISYWLPTLPGAIAYLHLRRDVGARNMAGGRAEGQ
jgi:putative heme transporter